MARFCLQIIDSFFPDPDAVRAKALETAIDLTGGNPGLTSLNVDVTKNMKLVGRVLKLKPDYKHLRHQALFRLTLGSDSINETDIDADGPVYAGHCFLNLPSQCSGGTTFFRHKRSGLETYPTKRQVVALITEGLLPPEVKNEEKLNAYFWEQGSDRANWEATIHVPMAYNRALFYNGNLFHAMSSWHEFGETKETARLMQLFYFHEA